MNLCIVGNSKYGFCCIRLSHIVNFFRSFCHLKSIFRNDIFSPLLKSIDFIYI